MTPLGELASNQPFSAPFKITNSGYLGLHVDNVITILHKVEYGGLNFYDAETGNKDWDNFDLKPSGGTKTIRLYFSNGTPTKADIVFAVDYRILGIKLSRTYFRFIGAHIDNWVWTKQPMGELESTIDKSVDDALTKHAAANRPN